MRRSTGSNKQGIGARAVILRSLVVFLWSSLIDNTHNYQQLPSNASTVVACGPPLCFPSKMRRCYALVDKTSRGLCSRVFGWVGRICP